MRKNILKIAYLALLMPTLHVMAQDDSSHTAGYGGHNLSSNRVIESSRVEIKAKVDPIIVFGPVVGKLGNGMAQCPAGTKIMGGGYQLLIDPGRSHNTPDASRPDPAANGWIISGAGSNAQFRPWAVCG